MYFASYGFRKAFLVKCLKSRVSDEALTSNMVNGIKICWNLNFTNFTIFIDHCEGNEVRKSLSYWYAKSQDCFLTHWLPVRSIPFLKDNLKPPTQMQLSPKGKTFSQFFSAFLTCRFNFEDFQEKDDPHNWCILEVTDSKNRGQMNV